MTTEVSLAFRSPFDADGLLSFLGARSIEGVEEVRDGTYSRSVWTARGPAVVRLTPSSDQVALELVSGRRTEPDLDGIVSAARAILDLDADPAAIDETLRRDQALVPLVARRPGIRVPGTFDRFELVLRGIFGQQVSVAGARTALGRFASRFGSALDRPFGSITHAFPRPDQVAEIDPAMLGMPRGRARAIRHVGELAAAGALDLSEGADRERTLETLADVPGIGPWTLAYVSMRALREPDAFLEIDLGVRRGFESLGLPATTPAIRERAERWRPWRAYAVMHLWHADR